MDSPTARAIPPRLTLIIAVYNKPDVLRLVLAACGRQTMKEFEIVVADDGSGPEVARVIADAREAYGLAIRHVWQEDRGWRKNSALNAAIRIANSGYLVFIDGDCIPHRRFVEDHWRGREERKVLCGRRADMSERWSKALSLDDILSGAYERHGLAVWWDGLRGRAQRVEDGLRFIPGPLGRLLHAGRRGILGCNFSIHAADLALINGFDEQYRGPGCGEDSDLEYRLGLIGVTCKPLRHRGIQFHVYHPGTRESAESLARFEQVRQEGNPWCAAGLAHSTEPAAVPAPPHPQQTRETR